MPGEKSNATTVAWTDVRYVKTLGDRDETRPLESVETSRIGNYIDRHSSRCEALVIFFVGLPQARRFENRSVSRLASADV